MFVFVGVDRAVTTTILYRYVHEGSFLGKYVQLRLVYGREARPGKPHLLIALLPVQADPYPPDMSH